MKRHILTLLLLVPLTAAAQYTVEAGKPEEAPAMTEATKQGIIDTLLSNMVTVEGGTFQMGATPDQGDLAYDDEKPVHQVTLSTYKIGRYEVTQREWEAVMGRTEVMSKFTMRGPNMPMYAISWEDCQEFIKKLNAKTGHHFRLPTEAEWEFAARGGNKSRGTLYAGSNKIEDVAWTDGTTGMFPLTSVGMKQPNELGLYDMSGHVSEWCSDWEGAYPATAQTNPKGPASGKYKIRRGGSFHTVKAACRASARQASTPVSYAIYIGFRLAE